MASGLCEIGEGGVTFHAIVSAFLVVVEDYDIETAFLLVVEGGGVERD